MGLHHRKYASFSRQTLFLRLINVFSAPCYPEAYECSIQRRPVLASPVSLQAAWQPDRHPRAAQERDAINMKVDLGDLGLRKVQAIASVRALGTSLATADIDHR